MYSGKNETHHETKTDHNNRTNSDNQNVTKHEHNYQPQQDDLNGTQLVLFASMKNDTDSFFGLKDQIEKVNNQIKELIAKEKTELDKFKAVMVEIKNFLEKEKAAFDKIREEIIHGGPVQYSLSLLEINIDHIDFNFKECLESLGISKKSSAGKLGNFLMYKLFYILHLFEST